MVSQALATLVSWFRASLHALSSVLAVIDTALRQDLGRLGIPADAQRVLLLIINVALIILVLRLFGGVIRVLLVVFFVLLLVHVLAPGLGL